MHEQKEEEEEKETKNKRKAFSFVSIDISRSSNWVREIKKVTSTLVYTISPNVLSRCFVKSSIVLNKQANIRLAKEQVAKNN